VVLLGQSPTCDGLGKRYGDAIRMSRIARVSSLENRIFYEDHSAQNIRTLMVAGNPHLFEIVIHGGS
jgi:hypothetical protein